jgi:hypothetical protein
MQIVVSTADERIVTLDVEQDEAVGSLLEVIGVYTDGAPACFNETENRLL